MTNRSTAARMGAISLAALALAACSSHPKRLDGSRVQDDIEFRLGRFAHEQTDRVVNLRVSCPAAPPIRRGYIFDCTMTGWPGGQYTAVRVTEDDDQGHVHYEPY